MVAACWLSVPVGCLHQLPRCHLPVICLVFFSGCPTGQARNFVVIASVHGRRCLVFCERCSGCDVGRLQAMLIENTDCTTAAQHAARRHKAVPARLVWLSPHVQGCCQRHAIATQLRWTQHFVWRQARQHCTQQNTVHGPTPRVTPGGKDSHNQPRPYCENMHCHSVGP